MMWMCEKCRGRWRTRHVALGHFNLVHGNQGKCSGGPGNVREEVLADMQLGWHLKSETEFKEWQTMEGVGGLGGLDLESWTKEDFEGYIKYVVGLVLPSDATEVPAEVWQWEDGVYAACKRVTVDCTTSEVSTWPLGLVWEMHRRKEYLPWIRTVVRSALEVSVGDGVVDACRDRDIVMSVFVRDFVRRCLALARLEFPSCSPTTRHTHTRQWHAAQVTPPRLTRRPPAAPG